MFAKFLRMVSPPICFIILQKVFGFNKSVDKSTLFDGDDEIFKNILKTASVYGEYGCGQSTKWVVDNVDCMVLSVDTSSDWVSRIKAATPKGRRHVEIHHVDLGAVGGWGRPLSYEKVDHFSAYTDWLWQQRNKPDVILIDGRFRVCCF